MKKFFLGLAAVVLNTSIAFAANVPVYNWSGFYAGAHGGYAWGKNSVDDSAASTAKMPTFRTDGGFGGVQFGYNFQFAPHWLIGSEFDFSFGNIRDSASSDVVFPINGKDSFDAFGTLRTRFGYVQDRTLVYGTLGAIWLHEKYISSMPIFAPGPTQTSDLSQYKVGWVFGGGVEYAFDTNWSFKLEYLYAAFSKTHDIYPLITHYSDPNLSFVRAGVNYRFGGANIVSGHSATNASAPNWNGSYVGVHGGYGWADSKQVIAAPLSLQQIDLNPTGKFGGFQGGFNWVFAPQWLFGFEVDSSWADMKKSGLETVDPIFIGPVTATAKIKNFGTARLRLGYLANNTLFYGTGGLAYGTEEFSDSSSDSSKVDRLGWVVGGGIEYKLSPDWSAKIEYDYIDFGRFSDNMPAVAWTRTSEVSLSTVKVGLNYSGPIIERFFGGR